MYGNHIFPFDMVDKNAHIIIYGAGIMGQEYLYQLWETKYCHIVFIVDENYKSYRDDKVEICDPKNIIDANYDCVVIAVERDRNEKEIRKKLAELGVPEQKIVYAGDRKKQCQKRLHTEENNIFCDEKDAMVNCNLSIAIRLSGGIGDYIIKKKFLQELIKLIPSSVIDIYATNEQYVKIFYLPCKNIRCIQGIYQYNDNFANYDISFALNGYLVEVDYFKECLISRFSCDFIEQIKYLTTQRRRTMWPLFQHATFIQFRKAKLRNWDAYTQYNELLFFRNVDRNVHIPMNEEYLSAFQKLKLNKYITVNYGVNPGKGQPNVQKMWPKEHFGQLTKVLKERFPDIEVIQLGEKYAEKIANADRFVLGESLELAKYILKNSLLHIDCDGGLVHIATQLGTKCVVLFGPTPVYYFGYPQNINIVSEICSDCYFLTQEHYEKCPRGFERSECMYAITPEMVAEKVVEYLAENIEK